MNYVNHTRRVNMNTTTISNANVNNANGNANGSGDAYRTFQDGTVVAAETRDASQWPDMPPNAYTIVLVVNTPLDRNAHVYLEVSTRPGRSDYTRDKLQWQLALGSLQKIDPKAGPEDLAHPERLVGMPCRVMGVEQEEGRYKWFLVKRVADRQRTAAGGAAGDVGQDKPATCADTARRLAAMTGGRVLDTIGRSVHDAYAADCARYAGATVEMPMF